MKKLNILFIIIVVLSNFEISVKSWSLEAIKHVTNFTIRHVTIYYLRAFLCIENTSSSRKIPTLIEATWPENIIPVQPHIFPALSDHATHSSECEKIQNAVSTNLDFKTRLWVMDNGSEMCPPKLLIYILFPWSEEILRESLNFIVPNKISSIICDPFYKKKNSARAFISLYDYDFLLVYYLKEKKFVKIYFRENNSFNAIKFYPSEITWGREDNLYLSNYATGELYSMNTSKLKEITENKANAPIKYVGDLLGKPKSLISDANGCLYYILKKYNAVLRWTGRRPLKAEKHEVLCQIPAEITQIVFGTQGSVWIVTSIAGSYIETQKDDHCARILVHYSAAPAYMDISDSDYDYNLY